MRSFEQSLLRLGTDRIDVLLIHDADRFMHGREGYEARFKEAMAGAYPALERLRTSGALKGIGIGVNDAEACADFARAGDFDCMLLAGRYSLLEQPALRSFLPLAVEKGIAVMLGGVFNSGILATGPVAGARYNYRPATPEVLERVGRIGQVCRSHGVALPEAALQFPLAHPAVASVVLGAVTPEEVSRNIAALAKPIPAGLWRDLKSEGLLDPGVPVPD
jgi:D-threo-aldose 1-dehydrogenase